MWLNVHLTALLLACAPSEPPVEPPAASEAPAAPAMPRTKAVSRPEVAGTVPASLGVPVGQPAPGLTLPSASGEPVSLAALYAAGPALVVFYRGGWCPFCSFQAQELAAAMPEFKQRGVTPVLISVDRIDEAMRTQTAFTLPFPVLSDSDLAAHEAFSVVHQADEAEVARLRGLGIDLEAASGKAHHRFAVPSVFLVDQQGVVRWSHADLDYKVRPSPEQLLAAIDGVFGG